MTYSLRPLAPQDKTAVLQILKGLAEFEPDEVEVAEELIDAYLQDGYESGYHPIVAEAESKIAGYALYGPTPLTRGTWDIYWMAVSAELKNRGLGTKLLQYAEKDIVSSGGRLILIETSARPLYENTRKFYEGNYYAVVCRIADFYAPGDDKIIYLKRLSSC
ncbi:MAG TPA: GNAT family N-acetyltransferase [Dehalococcoidia bacterium]|nr:GNAT family N-acetyltransferase [Dehalococcoidia bacterium]